MLSKDICMRQTSPNMCQKMYVNVSKETYIYKCVNRDRYIYVKRDMYMSQTRPFKKIVYKCIHRIFFVTHVLTACHT